MNGVAIAPDVPYFDVSDPDFSVSSADVLAARERSWYARTNFGLAVLRYEQTSLLLKDRRLRQGSFAWPEQHGITEGLLHDWWSLLMLSAEGDDHRRLRRLANPAFSRALMETDGAGFQAARGRARRRVRRPRPVRLRGRVRRAVLGPGAVPAGRPRRGPLARPLALVDRYRPLVRRHDREGPRADRGRPREHVRPGGRADRRSAGRRRAPTSSRRSSRRTTARPRSRTRSCGR